MIKTLLGNVSYFHPAKLYFGDDAQKKTGEEWKKSGPKVPLTYGAVPSRRTAFTMK
ncbi:hypothetical protein AB9N12_17555 [Bacteroides sp. AN502(2024)]|uniref:hypothetical protein n=1 Tax=Bacteroides sp. AN502(2024) TaxID=3160599 RepID=UPI003518C436